MPEPPERAAQPSLAGLAAMARALGIAGDPERPAMRRRSIRGHLPDCPDPLARNARRCPFCRSEVLARDAQVINGVLVPDTSILAAGPTQSTREPEERSCRTCFAPTTDPEGKCTKCRSQPSR